MLRTRMLAPILAVMLAVAGLAGSVATDAHAQTYGNSPVTYGANFSGTVILPVTLGYGEGVQLTLISGQQVTYTCSFSYCPAGMVIDLSQLIIVTAVTPYTSAPIYSYSGLAPVAPTYVYPQVYQPTYSVMPVFNNFGGQFGGGFSCAVPGSCNGFGFPGFPRSFPRGFPNHGGTGDHDHDCPAGQHFHNGKCS